MLEQNINRTVFVTFDYAGTDKNTSYCTFVATRGPANMQTKLQISRSVIQPTGGGAKRRPPWHATEGGALLFLQEGIRLISCTQLLLSEAKTLYLKARFSDEQPLKLQLTVGFCRNDPDQQKSHVVPLLCRRFKA